MASIKQLDIIKKLQEKKLKFFTRTEIASLMDENNRNNIYKIIQRLEKNGIIRRIVKGKYVLENSSYSTFSMANFVVSPSYISFESALNFWGVLPQFPYIVTSVTLKKSVEIDSIYNFEYQHMDAKYFWGYEKTDDFLIAKPEKALLDIIYLQTKGLRKIDMSELDFSIINRKLLNSYIKVFNIKAIKRILKKI